MRACAEKHHWCEGMAAVTRFRLATLALLAAPTVAQATPRIDVRSWWGQTFFDLDHSSAIADPDGFAVTCGGTATGGGFGCGDSLQVTRDFTASEAGSIERHGWMTVTNISAAALSYAMLTRWSAFNPGGPNVGLAIDDPLTQIAHYSSRLTSDVLAGDYKHCGLPTPDAIESETEGVNFSDKACGVVAPDDSDLLSGGGFLDPGASFTVNYTLAIAWDFAQATGGGIGVPEPGTAWLLLVGVLGLLPWSRRRQRLSAESLSSQSHE